MADLESLDERAVARLQWEWNYSHTTVESELGTLAQDEVRACIDAYFPIGGRILDGGCGLGRWTAYLAAEGYAVTGVEQSESLVARVQQVWPHLDVRQGNIHGLAFEDGWFDGYLSYGVFESYIYTSAAQFLSEAARVLRPGGTLILTTTCENSLRRLRLFVRPVLQPFIFGQRVLMRNRFLRALLGKPPFPSHRMAGRDQHRRDSTVQYVKQVVESCGFHVERIDPIQYEFGLLRLSRVLPLLFTAGADASRLNAIGRRLCSLARARRSFLFNHMILCVARRNDEGAA